MAGGVSYACAGLSRLQAEGYFLLVQGWALRGRELLIFGDRHNM